VGNQGHIKGGKKKKKKTSVEDKVKVAEIQGT